MIKHLHIVSFDVPYPPNYGGIIDIFYKIKALHALGLQIHLHTFYYKGNNQPTSKLEKYCNKISYYKRKKNPLIFLKSGDPFIVSTRKNKTLLKALLKDSNPILFEGLHTTAYLNNTLLKDRIKVVRTHNIEHEYYSELARTSFGFRKKFFHKEARRLAKFEKKLKNATLIASISKSDVNHFNHYAKTIHLPAFYDDSKSENQQVKSKKNILFQGNLAVSENENAVFIILGQLADKTEYELIIAGSSPSKKLVTACKKYKNVTLAANLENDVMLKLAKKAHINLLIAEKPAGIKLKLLFALQHGQHVLINDALNDDEIFSPVCSVAEITNLKPAVEALMNIPFTLKEKKEREDFLRKNFNNNKNAEMLLEKLYPT